VKRGFDHAASPELRKVLVPNIPIEEQYRIAESIRNRKKLINDLKLKITEESNLMKEEIGVI
jgi:restriction endonuclease S subunit